MIIISLPWTKPKRAAWSAGHLGIGSQLPPPPLPLLLCPQVPGICLPMRIRPPGAPPPPPPAFKAPCTPLQPSLAHCHQETQMRRLRQLTPRCASFPYPDHDPALGWITARKACGRERVPKGPRGEAPRALGPGGGSPAHSCSTKHRLDGIRRGSPLSGSGWPPPSGRERSAAGSGGGENAGGAAEGAAEFRELRCLRGAAGHSALPPAAASGGAPSQGACARGGGALAQSLCLRVRLTPARPAQ